VSDFPGGVQDQVLRGMGVNFKNGRPEQLEGTVKLEDDLHRITLQVLLDAGLMRFPNTPAERGRLSRLIHSALEDETNWWPGQPVPIELDVVAITFFDAKKLTGAQVTQTNTQGNVQDLLVSVTYAERVTGAVVNARLVIPFGRLQ
jgi:hypothetical protein